ncbi:MAG: glutathione S-transferase [Rhizobiaceae bacterium]|nr:glutathione S-transferase [Rhizobiaceae bacterium]
MEQLPVLYSFRRCPYAMRARLAIAVSGEGVELREILLRDKAPELLEISPKATVPVLVDRDGSLLEESLDIMLWALEKNDPLNWLKPQHGTLSEMLALINQCDNQFKPHLDRYKYANRYEDVDANDERDKAGEFLWQLDKRLASNEYLFGTRSSLADMAIVTFVRQFANVDRAWFDGSDWQNLQRWLVEFLQSDRFQAIMDKYLKWQMGDEVMVFGKIRNSQPI